MMALQSAQYLRGMPRPDHIIWTMNIFRHRGQMQRTYRLQLRKLLMSFQFFNASSDFRYRSVVSNRFYPKVELVLGFVDYETTSRHLAVIPLRAAVLPERVPVLKKQYSGDCLTWEGLNPKCSAKARENRLGLA